MKRLSKKQKQNLEIIVLILIGLTCFFLWDTVFVYPIKLFVVLTHEISHGIASILSGGKVTAIQINEYLGGECITEGGNKFVIATAGYMGSLIFGSVLFLSSYNKKIALWSCTVISVILLLFTANFLYGGLGIALAMMYTIILFLSPRYFKPVVNTYVLKILGLVSILYVLIDIKQDILTVQIVQSDAHILADITGVPSIIWGLIWISITMTVMALLVRNAYLKGFRISK